MPQIQTVPPNSRPTPDPEIAALSRPEGKWVVVGVMAIAVLFVSAVAGAPRSGLTPFLPPGAGPLVPFRWLARVTGIRRLSASPLPLTGIVAVALVGGAFVLAAWQAWRGRLSLRTAIWVGVALHVVFVALPLLISHDAYHYALYGRIAGIHHQNPYVVTPSHFPRDPLFPFFSQDWRNTPAVYGPAFIQIASIAARLIHSPAGLVFFFKLLSGVASLAVMLLLGRLVNRFEPARAAFAVILIGWNPVVLVDTVGAGHMDSLIALTLVLALGLLLGPGDPGSRREVEWRELGVTAMLALAALLKANMVLPLVLFVLVCARRCDRGRRLRALAMHLGVIVLLAGPLLAPFEQRADPLLGITSLFKAPTALAPSTFLRTLVRFSLGTGELVRVISDLIATAFTVVVALAFVALLLHLVRRAKDVTPVELASAWGWVVLLFLLAAPRLWPWYLVWVLPVAWAMPLAPRMGIVVMSAAMPAFAAVAEGTVYPVAFRTSKAMAVILAAPVLLGYLVFLVADEARRVRSGVPMVGELSPRGLMGVKG